MTITDKKETPGEIAGRENPKRQKLEDPVSTIPKPEKIINDYEGFSFQDATVLLKIDTVGTTKTNGEEFFTKYVAKRKPCVLDQLPTLENGQPIHVTRELLDKLAGNHTIQVERRFSKEENFGQNRTAKRQILLTISELLERMTKSTIANENKDNNSSESASANTKDEDAEMLYWSTQEDTEDPYNVPCRQLVDRHLIPSHLPLAGNLVLSSCNLWMGSSANGASSGLHHDYHDNFYLLLQGKKRFRLLSPDCAPHLSVYGTIVQIHKNGRISYEGNETRADGVPLDSLEQDGHNQGEDGDEEEEEEELVLGKGFDYVSDNEDNQFDARNQTDDFDELMGEDNQDHDDNGEDMKKVKSDNTQNAKNTKESKDDDDHPDSFSRINPCLDDQASLETLFPGYACCRQVLVELQAGQMLYLPAGWFHEVTSYSGRDAREGDEDDSEKSNPLRNCHMALNYWYHPPDALEDSNYNSPYQDGFWKRDEQQRLETATKANI